MSTLAVILIVLGAILLILFVGGAIATARRTRALEPDLRSRIEAANAELAEAHAQDKGWERTTVEAAAREAFLATNPGAPIDALHLVQVVDRPGTDADQAVFTVVSEGRTTTLTLGRRDGHWVAA